MEDERARLENQIARTENKWWLEPDAETAKRNIRELKEKARNKLEKERYLKAMQVLINEKSGGGGDMPNLCACNALQRGPTKDRDNVSMCATNCSFYKNPKAYEKAMKDVLSSIN